MLTHLFNSMFLKYLDGDKGLTYLKDIYLCFVQFRFCIRQYFTKKLKWNQGDVSSKLHDYLVSVLFIGAKFSLSRFRRVQKCLPTWKSKQKSKILKHSRRRQEKSVLPKVIFLLKVVFIAQSYQR